MTNKVLQINQPSTKLLEFVKKLSENKKRNKEKLLSQKSLLSFCNMLHELDIH